MAELNVQQKNIVNQLRQAYPELKSYSDEQILSLYNQQLNNIQLSEDERISIMNGRNGISNDGMGLRLEGTQTSVSKEQEAQLKSALTARLNAVSTNVKKAEDSNGFLGKAWSWAKNTFNFGDSSDKVKEQQKADLKALESGNIKEAFKQITGLDYTVENVNKFLNNEVQTKSETALNGYTEGQEMASDVIADIASGIAAVGIYTAAVAAAPFTGGLSIAVGVAAAGTFAAGIKTGIKAADAKSGGREYTADNLKKDLATGAFSGVLAPITGGLGGAVGKTVAVKTFGIQAVKQVGKEVAEEAVEQTAKGFIKTALTNPYGYEYIGGNVLKRAGAYSAEMITDGAVSGFFDSAFRTAYDGGSVEEVGKSALMGGVNGGLGAWFLGGGIKVFGRRMQKIFGKNNVQIDAEGNQVRVNKDGTVEKNNFITFRNLSDSDIALLQKFNIDLKGVKKPESKIMDSNVKIIIPTNVKKLDNELKRIHYKTSRDVQNLFEQNPNVNRLVGSLPRPWGKILKNPNGIKQVDESFSKFIKDLKNCKSKDNAINNLKDSLQNLLNKEVDISLIGNGALGDVYKISVDRQKYVLKIFKVEPPEYSGHGGWSELSGAVYASDKTKNVAKFYMGNFGETNTDTYMLNRYISFEDHDIKNSQKRFKMVDAISKFFIEDSHSANFKGWKIIDYGQFHETVFGKMEHEAYKILRQMCEAADEKSYNEMQRIVKQYQYSPFFKDAQIAYFEAIKKSVSRSNIKELRDLVKLLESFVGKNCFPDFNILAFENPEALTVFYDITFDEAIQINQIFHGQNNRKPISNKINYI